MILKVKYCISGNDTANTVKKRSSTLKIKLLIFYYDNMNTNFGKSNVLVTSTNLWSRNLF